MKRKPLIIVGGKGSGEIAMSVFEEMNRLNAEWDILGYINDLYLPGSYLGKYKIIGGSSEIVNFVMKGCFIHYTYHFNSKMKKERVDVLKSLNLPIECHATGIHPLSYINPMSKIGYGCLLLPFSATSSSSMLNNFIHVYTNGFVGHDSVVEDYSTIAASSIIGGRVIVQEGAHIGLNSCIREDVKIGKYSIVGMGAVVLKDVDDYSRVVGNPSRII